MESQKTFQPIYKIGWNRSEDGIKVKGCFSWMASNVSNQKDFCIYYSGNKDVKAPMIMGIQTLMFAFEAQEEAQALQADPEYISLFSAQAGDIYPAPACYLAPMYSEYWPLTWAFYWMQLARPLNEEDYRAQCAEFIRENQQLLPEQKEKLLKAFYPTPKGSICCKSVQKICFMDGTRQESFI